MTYKEFDGAVFYSCRHNKALRPLKEGIASHRALNAYDKDGYYHVRDSDVVFPLPEEEWCAENRRLFHQDVMEHGSYRRVTS